MILKLLFFLYLANGNKINVIYATQVIDKAQIGIKCVWIIPETVRMTINPERCSGRIVANVVRHQVIVHFFLGFRTIIDRKINQDSLNNKISFVLQDTRIHHSAVASGLILKIHNRNLPDPWINIFWARFCPTILYFI